MSVEAINSKGATPEFILHKALEFKPRMCVVIFVDEEGRQHSLMSHMRMQDLAWLKLNWDAQMIQFFSKPD